ncbi:transmembrane protein 143 [Rhinophrynus dorsalis]
MLRAARGTFRICTVKGVLINRSMGSLTEKMAEYRKMWKPNEPKNWSVQYQERFIPFSKIQLVEHLVQDFHSGESERHSFISFVDQLENSILHHYHSILEDLQVLYDPINPDSDALVESNLTDSEKLARESDVLDQLQPVLDQANFNVLSEAALAYALVVHHPQDGVQVYVNIDKYEYIRFWALGQRVGPLSMQMSPESKESFFSRSPRSPTERRYFKRVLVAARPRNAHMVLKCFKDIPLEGLEQLLPVVKVRTSVFDRTLLNTMLLVSGGIVFVNVGMVVLTDLKIGTSFLLFCFAGFMTFRAWKVFSQHRKVHSLELAHMLYYRSTSNNSELLGALTLRAQEEHAKEVILAHNFLKQLNLQISDEIDPKITAQVKEKVEAWLLAKTGLEITFSSERALRNLKTLSRTWKDETIPKSTQKLM